MRISKVVGCTLVALALAVLLSSFSLPAFAQEAAGAGATETPKTATTAKERDIRRFLVITGASQLARQTVRQMVEVYRKTMPEVPESFWTEFIAEFDSDDLVEQLVPVYDKNLSHDDIKALITFYESPAGRRYSQALPTIAAESEAVGRAWGEELANRVNARLAAEGRSTSN